MRGPRMLTYVPAVLGALLIVAGVAVVFWPAALVAAGAFLLVLDSRITAPPKQGKRPPTPKGDVVR
jgi:hypothetical protein